MFKFHPFLALAVCFGCGASFSANEGSGGFGGSGQAGEASGGLSDSAGSPGSGDAGALDVGGSPSTAGQAAVAGEGGSTTGLGGGGSGGQGASGSSSGAGGNPAAECSKLRLAYTTAVDKARVCDKDSTDECSATSVAQPMGCGCPVLVNAKSEYTATAKKTYQAYQAAKCGSSGVICDIYCNTPVSASCTQQTMTSGNTFVCTAGIGIQN